MQRDNPSTPADNKNTKPSQTGGAAQKNNPQGAAKDNDRSGSTKNGQSGSQSNSNNKERSTGTGR